MPKQLDKLKSKLSAHADKTSAARKAAQAAAAALARFKSDTLDLALVAMEFSEGLPPKVVDESQYEKFVEAIQQLKDLNATPKTPTSSRRKKAETSNPTSTPPAPSAASQASQVGADMFEGVAGTQPQAGAFRDITNRGQEVEEGTK